MIFILFRKIRSLYSRLNLAFSTCRCYLNSFGNLTISVSAGCTFGRGVVLEATDGGSITLGRRVNIAERVQIISRGGRIFFDDDVFVGPGSIVTSMESVVIGAGTLVAEYVVIRDQDHCIGQQPIRNSGFRTKPIQIGADVWIGSKASVLLGGSIGDRCVIGAHALVKSQIPAGMLAVGVPARIVKRVSGDQ